MPTANSTSSNDNPFQTSLTPIVHPSYPHHRINVFTDPAQPSRCTCRVRTTARRTEQTISKDDEVQSVLKPEDKATDSRVMNDNATSCDLTSRMNSPKRAAIGSSWSCFAGSLFSARDARPFFVSSHLVRWLADVRHQLMPGCHKCARCVSRTRSAARRSALGRVAHVERG